MSQKLELTPETIEYCMELEGKLKRMQSELDAAADELKKSFRAKADRLGVHSDIFEEWVDSAKMSMDKNAVGSLEDVRRNLLDIAKRIAEYIGSSSGTASAVSKIMGSGTIYDRTGEIADFVISKDGGMTVMPTHRPLPRTNVIWENPDRPGDGGCMLRDDAVISFRSGQYSITGAELNRFYGGPVVIYYTNGQPDFWPYCDKRIGAVEISDFTDDRYSNFAQADAIAAERLGISKDELDAYMDHFMLTWHECPDQKTVIAVPTAIHDAFRHYGGVSTYKTMRRVIARFDSLNCKAVTADKIYVGRRR